ncbi:type II secretion system F family protein [Aeromicrobium sp. CTD01-1L150]|uniref:type II secretion system F family protein n=1 Tax=Aeromicrobium sp. CTD01-1L150 TaxID=3341830 RepID=UPI0035C0FEC4
MGVIVESLRLPLALSAGAFLGLGIAVLLMALRGESPFPERSKGTRRASVVPTARRGRQILIGLTVGIVVLVVTRWFVLAIVLGVVVATWDKLFGGVRQERAAIVRAEGLATWIESLRDTIAGAVGLEQAIPATAVNAAPSIRPSLNLLVDRLRVREPLPDALMKFADDLDDASADLVVAALVLNSRLRGPGLRDVLTALATSSRDELDVRRRVEASRRSTRRSVQVVVLVITVVAGALVLFNQEYMAPYGTLTGQMVLGVVLAVFGLAVFWLRRLSGVEEPQRFLIGTATRSSP